MNQPAAAVPMVVLTRHQDHVETINKTLRNAGHPVHLSWLPDASDLGDALTQIGPEMLIVFADEGIVALPEAMDFRARFAPEVPVILVHERVDEATIAAAIKRGAQDAVTLADLDRLQLVVARELHTYRLNRALGGTLNSAREYRKQLQDILAGSADAIAHIQEGIVVDVNPAWLELFGYTSSDAMLGTPLMDAFDSDSHAALKGALVACAQGKWSGHPVKASAMLSDGSTLSLDLRLDHAEFDGEPCVRLSVPAQRTDAIEMERRLTEAVQRDPATGLLHRRYFLDALRRRLCEPMKAGVRLAAYLEPDKYDAVVSDIGVVAAEEFQALFAALVREQLQPGDIAGGFGGHGIMVLLERGTPRDADAWAMHVVKRVREEVFQVGDKSLSTTCTIGLALVPASMSEPDAPATSAFLLCREGHAQGGNRLAVPEQAAQERRSEDADRQWVRQIKSALMENRLRLVQQPIASLLGDDRSMFDVLVRMLDEKGQEILPSEFMPAAERHDLMKNIDRWVIGASMQFTASRQPGALFVRLSRDTVVDPSLGIWLQNQLKTTKIDASSIVFQVPAEVAASQLKPVVDLEQSLHASGFRFAIEGFGGTRDPEQLLAHLKPDFVKIHGALIQGLATDQDKQSRVKDLVELARGRGAVTVAERVEDANTMAVLWQLGVEFIQGFFVNAPEEVVLG